MKCRLERWVVFWVWGGFSRLSTDREEKWKVGNMRKKSRSISAESTETYEVEVVEPNEGDVTKKDSKVEHEGKPMREKRRSKPRSKIK